MRMIHSVVIREKPPSKRPRIRSKHLKNKPKQFGGKMRHEREQMAQLNQIPHLLTPLILGVSASLPFLPEKGSSNMSQSNGIRFIKVLLHYLRNELYFSEVY